MAVLVRVVVVVGDVVRVDVGDVVGDDVTVVVVVGDDV